MNKYNFKSIFQDLYSEDYPKHAISHFLSYQKSIQEEGLPDKHFYDSLQMSVSIKVVSMQKNIQQFEDEIEKTRKLLSEPCSAYLRHRLTDWYDYLREILKNDLEKYEKFKYDLLINFHYLV